MNNVLKLDIKLKKISKIKNLRNTLKKIRYLVKHLSSCYRTKKCKSDLPESLEAS